MTLTTLLLTALALAMDAVAVAIASGLAVARLRFRDALKMAFFFGAFQAAMPLLVYLLGASFATLVSAYTQWIAFVLLVGIGGKMLWEAHNADSAEEPNNAAESPFGLRKLTLLAIATSIDAFAVGVTFSLLLMGLVATVAVIGIVTFALCLPAVWFGAQLGAKSGARFAQRAEVFGGLVLIGIGVNMLVGHYWR